jgi:hypothetical protein
MDPTTAHQVSAKRPGFCIADQLVMPLEVLSTRERLAKSPEFQRAVARRIGAVRPDKGAPMALGCRGAQVDHDDAVDAEATFAIVLADLNRVRAGKKREPVHSKDDLYPSPHDTEVVRQGKRTLVDRLWVLAAVTDGLLEIFAAILDEDDVKTLKTQGRWGAVENALTEYMRELGCYAECAEPRARFQRILDAMGYAVCYSNTCRDQAVKNFDRVFRQLQLNDQEKFVRGDDIAVGNDNAPVAADWDSDQEAVEDIDGAGMDEADAADPMDILADVDLGIFGLDDGDFVSDLDGSALSSATTAWWFELMQRLDDLKNGGHAVPEDRIRDVVADQDLDKLCAFCDTQPHTAWSRCVLKCVDELRRSATDVVAKRQT